MSSVASKWKFDLLGNTTIADFMINSGINANTIVDPYYKVALNDNNTDLMAAAFYGIFINVTKLFLLPKMSYF